MNKLVKSATCKGCDNNGLEGNVPLDFFWSDMREYRFCSESCALYWRESGANRLPVILHDTAQFKYLNW